MFTSPFPLNSITPASPPFFFLTVVSTVLGQNCLKATEGRNMSTSAA